MMFRVDKIPVRVTSRGWVAMSKSTWKCLRCSKNGRFCKCDCQCFGCTCGCDCDHCSSKPKFSQHWNCQRYCPWRFQKRKYLDFQTIRQHQQWCSSQGLIPSPPPPKKRKKGKKNTKFPNMVSIKHRVSLLNF